MTETTFMFNRHQSFLLAIATILMAAFLAAGPVFAAPACDAVDADRFARAEADLRESYAAMRDGLAMLRERDFDITARQRAIGDDPEALFAWVRDNTYWVNYRGVLRGARGTLMDGYGSHADRALLLAALLESAGHQARIARGDLSSQQLRELAQRLPANGRRAPDSTDQSAPDAEMGRVARRLSVDVEEIRERVRQADSSARELQQAVTRQAGSQSRALLDQLDWPPMEADDGRVTEALADHWWVQVRTGEGWRDLDPARPDHRGGDRLLDRASDTFWPEDVPDDAVHTLTIEIVAEQLKDGRLRENVALSESIAAPDLLGQTVKVDLHPMDLPGPEALLGGDKGQAHSNLPEQVRNQTDWMPMLSFGGAPEYDKRILADGRVVTMSATAQARAMEEASGLLGGIMADRRSGDAAGPELTAVFLRLSTSSPGSDPVEHERVLMDVLGAGRRAGSIDDFEMTDARRAARSIGMLSSTEILAQANWWPVSYTLGHLLDGALKNHRAALGAVHALRRDSARLMGKAIETLSASGADLVRLAHHRQARSPHRHDIAITRLNLLSAIERLDLVDDQPVLTRGFDIIDNRVDVRTDDRDEARRIRLVQGVFDTVLEAELMGAGSSARNTSLEFARALESGSGWRVVEAADLPAGLDSDVAARLEASLAAGELIVMPGSGEAPYRPSWWRIDPHSGTTLGIGPDGRGQMTEQILTLMNSIDNAASAAATVQTVWSCILTKPSASAMECCIVRTGASIAANKALGKIADGWLEIASWAIKSKIYLAALGKVFGTANGAIVDSLPTNPC